MKQKTIDRIRKFTSDRDWEQYHTPANLAKSISIEANELLECFQWSDTEYDLDHVKEELADVLVYCRNMLDELGLDEDEIINCKMEKNEEKYPVELAKGSAEKYIELKKKSKAEPDDAGEVDECFWFEAEEDHQVLVTESGKRFVCAETSEQFNSTEQECAGWQRATLFIDYFGIWDLTAFAAGINATMAYGPFIDKKRKQEYMLTFSSPSEAEKTVYPFIDKEQEAVARKNVDVFYSSKTLQKKWAPVILKPICLRVYRDGMIIASSPEHYDPDEILTGGCEPIHIGDMESIEFAFKYAGNPV